MVTSDTIVNDQFLGKKCGSLACNVDFSLCRQGVVYGRAFQVQDNEALSYLENRECALGGYLTTIATFHSRDGGKQFSVIIYIATNKNEQWLGEASLQTIAHQITECSGPSGHNVEYLLRYETPMRYFLSILIPFSSNEGKLLFGSSVTLCLIVMIRIFFDATQKTN